MNRKNTKSLTEQVKYILWNNWDPIGLKTVNGSQPDNEYDSYAPGFAKLLAEGADAYKIATRLNQLAEVSMGLQPHPEHSAHVAKLLLSLVEEKP